MDLSSILSAVLFCLSWVLASFNTSVLEVFCSKLLILGLIWAESMKGGVGLEIGSVSTTLVTIWIDLISILGRYISLLFKILIKKPSLSRLDTFPTYFLA